MAILKIFLLLNFFFFCEQLLVETFVYLTFSRRFASFNAVLNRLPILYINIRHFKDFLKCLVMNLLSSKTDYLNA